jgi:hypothetical protein
LPFDSVAETASLVVASYLDAQSGRAKLLKATEGNAEEGRYFTPMPKLWNFVVTKMSHRNSFIRLWI